MRIGVGAEAEEDFAGVVNVGHEDFIEVADTGEGIAPEHQAKVFERFYRVDKTRSRAEGGAGLGLAIAKLAIARHGGRIELESTDGQGSTFRVLIPAAA